MIRKLVITGALGHIGSRFIRDVAEFYPEAEVILIDNLSTQRYGSLFSLPKGARYRFIEADILDTDLVSHFAKADVVVHLAAITDAANSFAIKDKVEQVNFLGVQKVAEACASAGAALIFPSTTSVYGTQEAVVSESCSEKELKPQSPYADTKLRAEKWLAEMGQTRGLRYVIFRLGTIFGASVGMRFHTAVNKFCWQAVMGQPITVWKTALHQKRPYLDLDDAVRAFRFVIDKQHFPRDLYNVVTLNATVDEILNAIRAEVPNLAVQFVDSPIMNQLSYNVDASKFKAQGFEPSGDLRRGVGDTIRLLSGVRI